MVKKPPSNAGDVGSLPGQGTKIPYAAGQLSPCATTTELARFNERALVVQTTELTQSGAHVPQLQRGKKPHMPQLERSPHAEMKSPCATTKT